MNNRTLSVAILVAVLALGTAALAQQKSIQVPADNAVSQLKPGTGSNVASLNCAICHSVDYIIRQPAMDASAWQAEVKKMIKTYGAPINEADAKVIADYIFAAYGRPASSLAAPAQPDK